MGPNVGAVSLEQSLGSPFLVKKTCIYQLMSFQDKISPSTRVRGFPASEHYRTDVIILNPMEQKA